VTTPSADSSRTGATSSTSNSTSSRTPPRTQSSTKGDVVGLPHGAETVGLVYNTDIVDEAPETVDDMVAVMEDYHDPENGKYGLGYPINSYSVSAWLQAFGGYFLDLDADPQLGVAEDETVKGLEFLVNNFKPYMPKDFSYGPRQPPSRTGTPHSPSTVHGTSRRSTTRA